MALNHRSAEENEEAILDELRAHHIEPEVWNTTKHDVGNELAKRAAREGADIVIAAGGDGTLHAVASGLVGTHCTLGIIAIGTMNNIAHSLGIPEDVADACEIIANGVTSSIDVGKVNDQIFLEVVGIGLEAALFPAAEEIKNTSWLSTIRGVIEGLYTLFTFQPTRFTLSFDGCKARRYRAIQVSVCNSPYYGARLQFAPHARMNDGLLDVLVYTNFSTLEFLRHANSISRGQRVLEPKITQYKIKSLHIHTDNPVVIHADGIQQGYTPATITVVPGVLRVRVPDKIADSFNRTNPALKPASRCKRVQSNKMLAEEDPLHIK